MQSGEDTPCSCSPGQGLVTCFYKRQVADTFMVGQATSAPTTPLCHSLSSKSSRRTVHNLFEQHVNEDAETQRPQSLNEQHTLNFSTTTNSR